MLPSIILILSLSIQAIAGFTSARASGDYKCRLMKDGLIVNKEIVPLEDYILEAITAYGKHTSSANTVLDLVHYSGVSSVTQQVPSQIVNNGEHFSTLLIQLRTAREHVQKVQDQLRCFEIALGEAILERRPERVAMRKVVQVLLEDVEHTGEKLDEQRNALHEAMVAIEVSGERDGEATIEEKVPEVGRLAKRRMRPVPETSDS